MRIKPKNLLKGIKLKCEVVIEAISDDLFQLTEEEDVEVSWVDLTSLIEYFNTIGLNRITIMKIVENMILDFSMIYYGGLSVEHFTRVLNQQLNIAKDSKMLEKLTKIVDRGFNILYGIKPFDEEKHYMPLRWCENKMLILIS